MSDASEPFSVTSIIIDRYKLRNPSLVPMLPADFVPAIGKVAVAWGFFEAAFEHFLIALTKADGIHDDKWRGLSFRRRRNLFKALMAKALGDCPAASLLGEEIVRNSEPAYFKRNLVVHGKLATGFAAQDGTQVARLVCVGRVNRLEVQDAFTVDQLDDLFYEIAHLNGRLHVLKKGDLGQPSTSPETLRLRAFLATNLPPDPTLSMPPLPLGS